MSAPTRQDIRDKIQQLTVLCGIKDYNMDEILDLFFRISDDITDFHAANDEVTLEQFQMYQQATQRMEAIMRITWAISGRDTKLFDERVGSWKHPEAPDHATGGIVMILGVPPRKPKDRDE